MTNSLRSFRKKANPAKKEFARSLIVNNTRSEKRLWEELKEGKLGVKFRRQVIIFDWIVDFCCQSKMLVIELDGKCHSIIGKKAIDDYRDRAISGAGFRILRIDSARVFTDLTTVLAEIDMAISGFIYKDKN